MKKIKNVAKSAIEMTELEISALQLKKNEEKVAKCKVGLEKLLIESGCELDISVIVTARGNIPQLNIIPKQK